MKFLIQTIDKKIEHDFAFTLLKSIDFKNWLNRNDVNNKTYYRFFDTGVDQKEFVFKSFHHTYVPIGSVEFVLAFLQQFHNTTLKPINVPIELLNERFSLRKIFNGTEKDLKGKMFVKSNDKIKNICGIFNEDELHELPKGNYQFSEVISIDSEWRAFVYNRKLVGLQNYLGEFTKFPNADAIKEMIDEYELAPIAYTLDVGVNDSGTFIIECHEFFSCGLYSFNSPYYPNMLYRAFKEIINKILAEI